MNKENTNTQQVNHHLVLVSLLNWLKKNNFIVTTKAGLPLLGEVNNIDDEEERKAFRMVEKVRKDRQTIKNRNMLWQENSSRKKYHRQIIGRYSDA